MLPDYGVATTAGTRFASVAGPALMHAADVVVPGDASSAAFLCVAAILKRGSAIKIDGVSLNPSRIGFVRTLERMGANISESRASVEGKEPIGTISAEYTSVLRGCEIPAQHFASVIDEVPVLALAAARAKGVTVFKGAGELRAKETDRIAVIIEGLGQLGVDAWCEGEDLFIEGDPDLVVPEGLVFDSHGDHRFAMTWALAGLCFDTPVTVKNYESCAVSYPNFLSDIQALAK
jgi:3-phosphoshikimate 1-carboxyvinyltransferase